METLRDKSSIVRDTIDRSSDRLEIGDVVNLFESNSKRRSQTPTASSFAFEKSKKKWGKKTRANKSSNMFIPKRSPSFSRRKSLPRLKSPKPIAQVSRKELEELNTGLERENKKLRTELAST